MMKRDGIALSVALLIALLSACGVADGTQGDSKHIVELEDSLRAYRDSLKIVQDYWSFNKLGLAVQMLDYEPKLGDSCYIEIRTTASNSEHAFFRHGQPEVRITDQRHSRTAAVSQQRIGDPWEIAFKPERTGLDSITGWVRLPHPLHRADTIWFSTTYEVKPR